MSEQSWFEFLIDRLPELWLRLGQHLVLTSASTGSAIAIGIPLGIVALRLSSIKNAVLAAVAILQTIPSLALLTLLLALTGKIGALPAIIALTLYALLPIVRNTITGLEGIQPSLLEAAEGIGMTPGQQLRMVQLPLALPVIIAGVRTAAVIGVGVATLSAFIGAGGLGQFINRGLALDNTRLILLGAIPSAILALVVDGAIAALGWAMDPMKDSSRISRAQNAARITAALLPVVLFGSGMAGYLRARPDVVMGSKAFSESLILGHMMADMIERRTDLAVERRFCLGGTMICHGALVSGEIDMYPEYTGTGLIAVLHDQVEGDAEDVYQEVARKYQNRFGLRWLEPFGINNTYAIAVRRDHAERYGWQRVSDLESTADNLRAGWTAEFAERQDGYVGLKQAYGIEFGSAVDIESGNMYKAVANGDVDVIAAYSTDGRIAAYDLVLLEDDRNFFPPYDAAPVVRGALLEEHPEIIQALSPLAGILDVQTMQRLNYEVDEYNRSPKHVAREFLVEKELILAEGERD